MSDLLSSPHHPAVNPNIILDNFLLDLKQSLLTRYIEYTNLYKIVYYFSIRKYKNYLIPQTELSIP